jgi:antitoxin component of MazEF toxin-antitoxin module
VLKMPVPLKVKLSKVGNSLKMTIPRPALWALGWEEGDTLEIDVEEDTMIVKKSE